MTVTIPDEAIASLNLSPEAIRLELGVALFAADKASAAAAARIAGLPLLAFRTELGRRRIPQHYGARELEEDLRGLAEMPLP